MALRRTTVAATSGTLRKPPSLDFQTLLTLARQRDGLNAGRCQAVLEFLETSGALGAGIRRELAADGLSRVTFAVLLALFAIDPVAASPSDLALHTGVGRPAVSSALDGLCRRQLVVRGAGTADRRVRYVTLTVAGREAVDRAAMRCLHLLGQAAQLLPPADLANLRATCALLHEGTLRGHSADTSSLPAP